MLIGESSAIPSSLIDTFELTLSRGIDLNELNMESHIFDLEFPKFWQAVERAGGVTASDAAIIAEAFVLAHE